MPGGMERWIWRQYQDVMPLHTCVFYWDVLGITMRNRVHQNHITLQLKFKNIFIYSCYVIIPWIL